MIRYDNLMGIMDDCLIKDYENEEFVTKIKSILNKKQNI